MDKKVFAELKYILEQVPVSLQNKIPVYIINNINSNYCRDTYKTFEDERIFCEYEFLKETRTLLEEINKRYWNEIV